MSNTASRVTFFLSYLGGGGAERVMMNLARGLVERGIKVDLVLGHAFAHLDKIPSGVRVIDLQAPQTMTRLFALTQYLRQEKPDALLSALHYTNEIAIWAKRLAGVSTRIVVSEHNTLSQSLQDKAGIRRHLIPWFVKHFYPLADEIVTVSWGAAKDLAKTAGLPLDSIHVIYNPVITPELVEKSREPLDHPWFKTGEPPVILGVGKLEAQKDFPTLIQAFAKVRQVRPARLMILGWGPDRPQLESLIKELGLEEDCSLPGYVDNPFPYMAHAAVFALSSAWEGLPTVLIEALAVGTSVVSTNCPSGPEEILDHGKYGQITPVGDIDSLATAILQTLSDTTALAKQDWLHQFTLEIATEKYTHVLGLAQAV